MWNTWFKLSWKQCTGRSLQIQVSTWNTWSKLSWRLSTGRSLQIQVSTTHGSNCHGSSAQGGHSRSRSVQHMVQTVMEAVHREVSPDPGQYNTWFKLSWKQCRGRSVQTQVSTTHGSNYHGSSPQGGHSRFRSVNMQVTLDPGQYVEKKGSDGGHSKAGLYVGQMV